MRDAYLVESRAFSALSLPHNPLKKKTKMEILKRFASGVALCMLLSFTISSHADEIQDANKLFKQGQLTQALDMVNGFLVKKPKDAQARFLKGLIVNEQGDAMQAISIFTELTNDYPELPEPYNNLAVLYAGQGQYEKAKVALEMAIRTHPSYATAHENLGDIYAKMASQAYDRALQLDKTNTGTQTKLALIRDLFGNGSSDTKPQASTLVEATPSQITSKPVLVAAPSPVTAIPVAPAPPQPKMELVEKTVTVDATPTMKVAPKTVVAPASDASAEVAQATHEWAAAWSAKNVKRYLAFYAADFKTPHGETRNSWEKTRRARISKPKSIKVDIENVKVEIIDANHARISFRQHYTASHFKSVSNKLIYWERTSKGWLILDERSDN